MYIRQSSVHTYIVEFLIYWFHPTHENWYTKNIIALTIHLDKGQDYIDWSKYPLLLTNISSPYRIRIILFNTTFNNISVI
jgi:hypothetical protein